tara:strand:- start:12891 stop:13682 length:792 start_codon:yes stop_codon:yes gene_type:complete
MAIVPLSKEKHSHLLLGPLDLRAFSNLLSIPVYFHEIRDLACDFPLFLSVTDDIVGLRLLCNIDTESSSPYINAEGGWRGRYVPIYLRQQPFTAASIENSDRKTIFIDDESPRFCEEGELLFENSEPTELLQNIMEDLGFLLNSGKRTQLMLDTLKKFELITPWELDIKSEDGLEVKFSDLHRINEAALNELNIDGWSELKQCYAFPIIYGQLLSMGNIQKLVFLKNSTIKQDQNKGLQLDVSEGNLDFELNEDSQSLNFDNV